MGHIRDRWKDPARKGKGHRWQVRYTVDGRERVGGSYDVKAVAQRRLVELESAAQRGEWLDPTDRTTVTQKARAYAATRPWGRSTTERVDGYIRNHLESTALGKQRLVSVRSSDVQAWVTERSVVMAPTTLRAAVKFVRAVFTSAVLDRQIASSPFVRIALPRFEQEWDDPLTVDQVLALAAAMLPKYRAMVVTQAAAGLRIGELLALRVEDIDFLRRMLRVEHQIDARSRERVPPKTPESRRSIPLIPSAAEALAEHIRLFPPAADGLLFHTREGLPYLHEFYSSKVFHPAAVKAGLPPTTSPHALRHHFASKLVDEGMSVVEVAGLLGHKDATQVIKVYGRRIPGSEDRMRKVLQAVWDAASGPSDDAATAQGRPQ